MESFRRMAVFCVCLPLRFALAAVTAWSLPLAPYWVRYSLAIYSAWTAFGFWLQATVVRPARGGFGGVVWWSSARWWHAVLWTLSSLFLFATDEWWASLPLFVDACFATWVTLRHHCLVRE